MLKNFGKRKGVARGDTVEGQSVAITCGSPETLNSSPVFHGSGSGDNKVVEASDIRTGCPTLSGGHTVQRTSGCSPINSMTIGGPEDIGRSEGPEETKHPVKNSDPDGEAQREKKKKIQTEKKKIRRIKVPLAHRKLPELHPQSRPAAPERASQLEAQPPNEEAEWRMDYKKNRISYIFCLIFVLVIAALAFAIVIIIAVSGDKDMSKQSNFVRFMITTKAQIGSLICSLPVLRPMLCCVRVSSWVVSSLYVVWRILLMVYLIVLLAAAICYHHGPRSDFRERFRRLRSCEPKDVCEVIWTE